MRYTPKTKPFPHQAKATLAACRTRNYGIFMEPRCGKSKAALDVAGIWAQKRGGLKVLILGPRISLDVWDQEIRQHYPHFAMVEDFEAEWSYAGNADYITQFFLASREEVFRRTRDGKGDYQRPKQDALFEWNPDLVVVDESHEYARPGGVGAQDLWRLIRRMRKRRRSGMPYVLLLSGTPNPKGWRSLFAQFRIMDEHIFGTNAATFDHNHCVFGVGKRQWTVVRYRNERKLLRKVRENSISVSAEQAGLANKVFMQTLRAKLPPHALKMYLEMAAEFVTEWEGGVIDAKNAGVKRIRLLQILGGHTTDGQQIHGAKLEVLQSYLKVLLEQRESVVVYSRFSPEVEACTSTLADVGFRTFRVDGSTSRADRQLAIAALKTRPETPVGLSFQYQAGSRAIELVGAAETVYYSTPDGWVDYFQTMKRTQGPNQKRPVRYTHIIVPGTMDKQVIEGLRRKENWHDTMMANPRAFLGLLR